MAWPLTGSALTKYNRLLSDLQQYGDFIFVGAPDDITWLQETIVAASDGVLRPNLDDVANRSHYWMLRTIAFFAEQQPVVAPSTPCPECPPVIPCPPCPAFYYTTTPSGLENEFGLVLNSDIPGLIEVVINGASVGDDGVHIEAQTDLVSFSAPDLVMLDSGAFVELVNNGALTGFSLPVLTTLDNVGYVLLFLNPSLTSFSLPALTTIDNGGGPVVSVSDNAALTSFSLPALATVDNGSNILATNNPALTSVSLGSAIFGNGTEFVFTGDALTDTSVNHILARGVASALYVTGTIDTSGGTSSAPTGQGTLDKATLIGRGVTVNTN